MTSDRQLGLLPERADQCRVPLHRFQSPGGIASDFGDGVQTHVGQLALFGVTEQVVLHRIELWRVPRQAIHGDLSVEQLDVVADHAAAMGWQAVPDDQQLAFDL